MKPNVEGWGGGYHRRGRSRVGDVHGMKNKKKKGQSDRGLGKQETETRGRGRAGDGIERYTSPCPCKVLRAVEAAAKNVSAQPSHAA